MPKTGHITIPDTKDGVPPLHLRGGSIIPYSVQEHHVNTASIRKGSIQLLVLPGKAKTAEGDLFWDDGDSIDTIENNKYNYYSFHLNKDCSLEITVQKSGYSSNQTINLISVKGVSGDPIEATLDGKPIQAKVKKDVLEVNEKINLSSKKAGEKWTLNWKSSKSHSCNLL